MHRPRLLLRIEMQQLIARLWREHGFTALLVTHDVGEAVALADRVLSRMLRPQASMPAHQLPHAPCLAAVGG